MSTKSKTAKTKCSVHSCPQGCGYCLHNIDQHKAYPICLGIVHGRRALTEPSRSASHSCSICLVMHGLSEDEQEALSSGQYAIGTVSVSQDDTYFFFLCHCTAKKLDVEWPSPPSTQKPSWFAGFFLTSKATMVKNHLPMRILFQNYCQCGISCCLPASQCLAMASIWIWMQLKSLV